MQEKDFNIEEYEYINDFIESKIHILRKNEQFNNKYIKLLKKIEELERKIPEEYKKDFNEIIDLFYETEKFYLPFSYSLGIKYGSEINKL